MARRRRGGVAPTNFWQGETEEEHRVKVCCQSCCRRGHLHCRASAMADVPLKVNEALERVLLVTLRQEKGTAPVVYLASVDQARTWK